MSDELTIWKVRESLHRQWGTVVAIVLLAVLAAFVITQSMSDVYVGTARVVVGGTEETEELIDTAAVEAQSDAVALAVMEQVGYRGTLEDFQEDTDVEVVTRSVLELTAESSDPTVAAGTAQLMAVQYIERHADEVRAAAAIPISALERRRDQLTADLEIVDETIVAAGTVAPPAQVALREQLRTELSETLGQLTEVQVATDQELGATRIVLNAGVPEDPISPQPLLNLAIGLLAGIVLGLVVVMTRETWRVQLRRRDDIAEAMGAPVVGSLARTPRSRWSTWCTDGDWPRAVLETGHRMLAHVPQRRGQMVLLSLDADLETAAMTVLLADLAARSGRGTDVLFVDERSAGRLGRLLTDAGLIDEASDDLTYGTLLDGEGEPVDWFSDGSATAELTDPTRLRIVVGTWSPKSVTPVLVDHVDEGPRCSFVFVRAGAVTPHAARLVVDELHAGSNPVCGAVVVAPDKFDDTSGRRVPPSVPSGLDHPAWT